jgi:hypothetical protein
MEHISNGNLPPVFDPSTCRGVWVLLVFSFSVSTFIWFTEYLPFSLSICATVVYFKNKINMQFYKTTTNFGNAQFHTYGSDYSIRVWLLIWPYTYVFFSRYFPPNIWLWVMMLCWLGMWVMWTLVSLRIFWLKFSRVLALWKDACSSGKRRCTSSAYLIVSKYKPYYIRNERVSILNLWVELKVTHFCAEPKIWRDLFNRLSIPTFIVSWWFACCYPEWC